MAALCAALHCGCQVLVTSSFWRAAALCSRLTEALGDTSIAVWVCIQGFLYQGDLHQEGQITRGQHKGIKMGPHSYLYQLLQLLAVCLVTTVWSFEYVCASCVLCAVEAPHLHPGEEGAL